MKILWITNIPIGEMASRFSSKPVGGLWMDALLNQLIKGERNSYVIITTANTESVISQRLLGIQYYLIPGGIPVHYKRDISKAKEEWKRIYETERPDVIQVWGTEYSHAIPALEVASEYNIPSAIYIQGIMVAIEKYATGNVPLNSMIKYITLRDVYRSQILAFQKSWFKKRAKIEKKLIYLSGNVIVENKWAETFCKSINPVVNIYKIPLNINEEFYQYKWSPEEMVPHTILCNAGGQAYKGIHVLLKALVLIREHYPDVKLYIPGKTMLVSKAWIKRQKVPGYWVYISDFIIKHNLTDNVIFTGYLSQKELAEKLARTNVFVLASAIENHSSSLKEAMAIGTPSVASLVGGIPEYFCFNNCGFSYRYEEYECLAGYICELFENLELCKRFSLASIQKTKETDNYEISRKIEGVYKELYEKRTLKEMEKNDIG